MESNFAQIFCECFPPCKKSGGKSLKFFEKWKIFDLPPMIRECNRWSRRQCWTRHPKKIEKLEMGLKIEKNSLHSPCSNLDYWTIQCRAVSTRILESWLLLHPVLHTNIAPRHSRIGTTRQPYWNNLNLLLMDGHSL